MIYNSTVIISSICSLPQRTFIPMKSNWRNKKLNEMKTFDLFMRLSGNERELWVIGQRPICSGAFHSVDSTKSTSFQLLPLDQTTAVAQKRRRAEPIINFIQLHPSLFTKCLSFRCILSCCSCCEVLFGINLLNV